MNLRKISIDEITDGEHLVLARPVLMGTGVKGYNAGVHVNDKIVSSLKRLGFAEIWVCEEDGFSSNAVIEGEDPDGLTLVQKFQMIKDEISQSLADIMTEKDPEREMLRIRNMTRGGVGGLMQKGALTKIDPERPLSEIKSLKKFSEAIISSDKLEKFLGVCRDLLEGPFSPGKIDKLKINLLDNRTEGSYIFNHLANCGLYFLATIARYNADLKKRGAVSSDLKFSQDIGHEKKKNMLFYYSDEEVLSAALGCFVHDIGYLHSGMPEILAKQGAITREEHDVLKKHVEVSMNILQYHLFFDSRPIARNVIENHHERLDGTGYPKGRKNFHVFSRALAMIDCFDSMTTDRPWRKKFSRAKVLEWLYDKSAEGTAPDGTTTSPLFDRELVHAFERILLLYEENEVVDIFHVKSAAPVFRCAIREQNPLRPDRPKVELLQCYPDPAKDVKGRVVDLLQMKDLYLGEYSDFRKEPIV